MPTKIKNCSHSGWSRPSRATGRFALDLVGLRADQDVDRIADGIDADEHDERHHRDDEQALSEAADQIDQHGDASRLRCPISRPLRRAGLTSIGQRVLVGARLVVEVLLERPGRHLEMQRQDAVVVEHDGLRLPQQLGALVVVDGAQRASISSASIFGLE